MPQIKPYKFYSNGKGRTVSVYSSYIPPDCELVTDGFTVHWDDGTSGRLDGGKPFESEAEGLAYLDRVKLNCGGRYPSGWHAMGN